MIRTKGMSSLASDVCDERTEQKSDIERKSGKKNVASLLETAGR